MWSLFRKKEKENNSIIGENNGIFDYSEKLEGDELKPLLFTNGKNQADVVKEVLDLINKGEKIIFIHGVCGTGKSSIALNLARHFKKTAVVVPVKTLQDQYEKDYTKEMFILKNSDGKNKKLKISVIKGRQNFSCPFLGKNADENDLPCTIDLREKNMDKMKEFIKMNPYVNKSDFEKISDVRRMSVAPACPYWSPLLPSEASSRALEKAKKIKYGAICGKEFALFQRKKGCSYYNQYESYADADVLVFNSMKYLIENEIGRKPKTDLDVIDECDEFLDSFADEKRINLTRLVIALSNLFPDTREKKEAVRKMIFLSNELLSGEKNMPDDVMKIKDTDAFSLIMLILQNPHLAEYDENNYYNNVFETAKSFSNLLDETYISIDRVSKGEYQKALFGSSKEQTVYLTLVSINLAQKLKEIIDSNNVLVLMSGTLHSEQILRDIFGLDKFSVVEAEKKLPGTITKYRTGLEKNFKYENFKNNLVSRKDYLNALNACIANAEKPALIHVNSFEDLPSESEKDGNHEIISREELKEMQRNENSNSNISKFKKKEINLLFTTKCSRGMDFPGEQCNSIILTKYPYPNIRSLFWKILKKEKPDKFFEFYYDKAKRELIQKIMRGVRFKGDHVLLLSPDSRVLDARLF